MGRKTKTTGIVAKVSLKELRNSTIYSFKIAGEGWFSTKFDEPTYENGDDVCEGDEISFSWEKDDNYNQKNAILDSIELISEGNDIPEEEEAPKKPARRGRSGGSSRGGTKTSRAGKSSNNNYGKTRTEEYFNDKDLKIAHGFSRDAAVRMLQVFVAAGGIIPIGTVKGKQLGKFKALVNELTSELIRDNNDVDAIKKALAGPEVGNADVDDEAPFDDE